MRGENPLKMHVIGGFLTFFEGTGGFRSHGDMFPGAGLTKDFRFVHVSTKRLQNIVETTE